MKKLAWMFLVAGLVGCGSDAAETPPPADASPDAPPLSDSIELTVKKVTQNGAEIASSTGTRTVAIEISIGNKSHARAVTVDPASFFVKTDQNLEVTPTGCNAAVRVAVGGRYDCMLTAVMPWSNKATSLEYSLAADGVDAPGISLPLTVADCTPCGTMCRADRQTCNAVLMPLPSSASTDSLAFSSTHVYWGELSGELRRRALSEEGGGTKIAEDLPGGIGAAAVDSTNLYWATPAIAPIPSVKKAPIGGGAPVTLFDGATMPEVSGIRSLRVTSTDVVFVADLGGAVAGYKLPIGGGTATKLADLESAVDTFTVDATNAYWITGNGELKKAPLAGGAPTVLASGYFVGLPPAVNATHVFVVVDDLATRSSRLAAVPIAGGEAKALIALASAVNGLVADAEHVYFAYFGNTGSVWKLALAGEGQAAPTQLGAGTFQNPGHLRLVDGRLYWATPTNAATSPAPAPPRPLGGLFRTY